jgi:hypothetical protein
VMDNPVCWTRCGNVSAEALQHQDGAGLRGLDPTLRVALQQEAPRGMGAAEVEALLPHFGGGEAGVGLDAEPGQACGPVPLQGEIPTNRVIELGTQVEI